MFDSIEFLLEGFEVHNGPDIIRMKTLHNVKYLFKILTIIRRGSIKVHKRISKSLRTCVLYNQTRDNKLKNFFIIFTNLSILKKCIRDFFATSCLCTHKLDHLEIYRKFLSKTYYKYKF